MANELLDFVMSLVRDPDAAARYAADPGQAIADAHLSDVTSADVNNLIPMVSDSLSMAAPALGGGAGPGAGDGNVWTSGAATAALDAFSAHLPDTHAVAAPTIDALHDLPVIDAPPDYAAESMDGFDHSVVAAPDSFDTSQVSGTGDVVFDHAAGGTGFDDLSGWEHDGLGGHPADITDTAGAEHPPFDIFS